MRQPEEFGHGQASVGAAGRPDRHELLPVILLDVGLVVRARLPDGVHRGEAHARVPVNKRLFFRHLRTDLKIVNRDSATFNSKIRVLEFDYVAAVSTEVGNIRIWELFRPESTVLKRKKKSRQCFERGRR